MQFLRLPDVQRKVGLSRATIYRYINQDKFPKPRRIGDRAVAWLEVDVNDWIERVASPETHQKPKGGQ